MMGKVGRRALAGGAALLPTMGLIGAARAETQGDSTLDRIRRAKTLRIAALPGELPYFQKNLATGAWSGAAIEMANSIAILTYDDLPAGHFLAHCDIVVDAQASQIAVIGGNVDDAVTLKHVPVTPDGRLAGPGGQVLDPRYPWMTVVRVLFPEEAPLA